MKKYLCAIFACLLLLPAASLFAEEPIADFGETVFDDETSTSSASSKSSEKTSSASSKKNEKYQNEITFTFGGWPTTEWLIGTFATSWDDAAKKTDYDTNGSFSLSLQYLHTTDDNNWTFGPVLTFSYFSASPKKADVKDYIVASFSLMIKVRKDYFHDNFVKLFADYAAGVEVLTIKGDSYPMLAWAAYPLGFSIGLKHVVLEFEFGLGNQGSLATISAGYRF